MTSNATGIAFGNPAWSRYNVTLRAMAESGPHGFAVAWNVAADGSFLYFGGGFLESTRHEVGLAKGGPPTILKFKPGSIERKRWYDVRIEVRGTEARCYLDGELLFTVTDPDHASGRVGLGGIGTAVRFKDIEVRHTNGEVLWKGLPQLPGEQLSSPTGAGTPKPTDFFDALKQYRSAQGATWTQQRFPAADSARGDWTRDALELLLTGSDEDARITFGNPEWTDYDFSFQAQVISGANDLRALFNVFDDKNYRMFELGAYGNTRRLLVDLEDGKVHGRRDREGTLKRNKWYDVRVAVRGRQCVCFLNGVEQSRNPGGSLCEGRVGLGAVKGTSVRFRDIKVTDEQGQPLWEGPPKLPGEPEPDAGGAASSIFNGKDLAGWKYLRGYWRVENGAIIGAPPPGANEPTCLFTEAAYKDFRLAFQIRLKGDRGISGAGFRSWMTDSTHCKLIGPQVKIGSAVSGQYPAGAVVLAPTDEGVIAADPTRAARAWKTNAFNAITVTCIGRHVTTTLNGTIIADGDVPASMPLPSEGYIGWQLGGKNAPKSSRSRRSSSMSLLKTVKRSPGKASPRATAPTLRTRNRPPALPESRSLIHSG